MPFFALGMVPFTKKQGNIFIFDPVLICYDTPKSAVKRQKASDQGKIFILDPVLIL
jgi:hypothetical protein